MTNQPLQRLDDWDDSVYAGLAELFRWFMALNSTSILPQ